MSKLAIKPIIISDKCKVELKDNKFSVSGPLGNMNLEVSPLVKIDIKDNKIFASIGTNDRQHRILIGTTYSLMRNMIKGTSEGFMKVLEIVGVGFMGTLEGSKLSLKVGFTHVVEFKIPDGIKVEVEAKGTIIKIRGIDKQLVGETAARIRRVRPPEPYKGTGIKYLNEHIIRKVGKAAITAAGGGGGKK